MEEKPRRRWLRFSVRTLAIVVTVACMWLGWNLHAIRQRQLIRQKLIAEKVVITAGEPAPWNSFPLSWRLLGEEPVDFIQLRIGEHSQADRDRIGRWFPE